MINCKDVVLEALGYINDREVLYQKHDLGINWSKYLPDSNWLLAAFVENNNTNIIDEIARKVIDKDVCYACCIGTFGEKMHELIEENLIIREVEIEKLHLPKHQVMTTWHKDITNGLWFAAFSALHESGPIDKIFFLDIGKDSNKDEVFELIDKFNKGFVPEDE